MQLFVFQSFHQFELQISEENVLPLDLKFFVYFDIVLMFKKPANYIEIVLHMMTFLFHVYQINE